MTNHISPQNIEDIEDKGKRLEALIKLCNDIRDKERRIPIPFNDFLYQAGIEPDLIFRNIFQLFFDMVKHYTFELEKTPGKEGYLSNSLSVVNYDCSNLFTKNCPSPFFADTLFTNRFMTLVRNLKKGNINNQIYLFEGPPGSGKSTFLNNLLLKMEEYTNIPEGIMYNSLWRIDTDKINKIEILKSKLSEIPSVKTNNPDISNADVLSKKIIEISCPNQDHPIIQIPKELRKKFLEELIPSRTFKNRLFNEKEYEWILKDTPCSICSSIYKLLLDTIGDPLEVFNMLYARKAIYSRQFGEGISVFNPGDPLITNPILQKSLQDIINNLFKTNTIHFVHSYLANTNNGILSLMDIKENNIERLLSLHGIISDGIHKVDLIEERINSLFLGIINPEDKKHFENIESFKDRIITVHIPYVVDYKTEVAIYENKFGKEIHSYFLPGMIENFAKIVISSRLNPNTKTIKEWIINPEKYDKYIDQNLFLLKMEIYTGNIPAWLDDEDNKKFNNQMRKNIIEESELEGLRGFSGRQSINIFYDFYKLCQKENKLANMDMLKEFFIHLNENSNNIIPLEFIQSLEDLYDYNVMQQLKESIYYFNKKQINTDIINYLYAINFEIGDFVKNEYNKEEFEITEDFFKNFEAIYTGTTADQKKRETFRKNILKEYISTTLTQEIQLENKEITETQLFNNLFDRYINSLKENALAPYIENESFRRAIIDFETSNFASYDSRLKKDVTYMINNLITKFGYTIEGAKQIAIYIVDKRLVQKFKQ